MSKDKSKRILELDVNLKAKVPEIRIQGYIGKWDEVNLESLRRKIENIAQKYKKVKLLINSGGGSMIEGFAIYDMLSLSGLRVIGVVEGIAASMASIVLLACDEIEIYENGRIMTHRPQGGYWGESDGMVEYAKTMDDLEEKAKKIYEARTGKDRATIDSWLKPKVDLWHNAETAVENGLADKIIKTVKKRGTKNEIEDMVASLEKTDNERELVESYCKIAACYVPENSGDDSKKSNNKQNTIMKKLFATFPTLAKLFGSENEEPENSGKSGKEIEDKSGEGSGGDDEPEDVTVEAIIEAFKKDGYELVKSADLKTLDEKVSAVLDAKSKVEKDLEDSQKEVEDAKAEAKKEKKEKETLANRLADLNGKEKGEQEKEEEEEEEEEPENSLEGLSGMELAFAVRQKAARISKSAKEESK